MFSSPQEGHNVAWLRFRHGPQYYTQQWAIFRATGALIWSGEKYWFHLPECPILNVEDQLARRYEKILDKDFNNMLTGQYPATMLVYPWGDFPGKLSLFMSDIDAIRERMKTNNWADVPHRELYPQYYGRTYHWQTDGYLSDRSAQLYDCSAELQLRGAANIIRRLTIPYLAPVLTERKGAPRRVLEIACGSGRLLKQLHQVFPHAQLNGIDLSPFYIKEASAYLGEDHLHLLRTADAATLGDPDGIYDGIVSVFLLHELPATLRRRIFANCYRMLRPGGRLVFVDSVQDVDDPFMGTYLRWILERFHEPYFPQYLAAPVAAELTQLGFTLLSADTYFLGKYFVAEKPIG